METPFSTDTLYFLFQLDSADEQTAAIRRELDSRAQKIAEMEKVNTIHTKKKQLALHTEDPDFDSRRKICNRG